MILLSTLICREHKLVADVAPLAERAVLLVRYDDVSKFDNETGWFIPDDYMKRLEHPDKAARRILSEQAGLKPRNLNLAFIESFGNNGAWHLIFHYKTDLPRASKFTLGENVREAKWFPLYDLPPKSEVAHGGWALGILRRITRK